jgi:hypothetical protein
MIRFQLSLLGKSGIDVDPYFPYIATKQVVQEYLRCSETSMLAYRPNKMEV